MNVRTAGFRIDGIEDNQARILDPAIREFEAGSIFALERSPALVGGEIDGPRRRQQFSTADMVVKKQGGAQ